MFVTNISICENIVQHLTLILKLFGDQKQVLRITNVFIKPIVGDSYITSTSQWRQS